jgi:peptidoglycan/LPS O-acetylase OafA/YrhL
MGGMRDMPNLDFLRSIAVISVVVEHILLAMKIYWLGPFQVAWIGVVGVMVFFVLTALVLMWSLERKPHTLDFYIRRWFRIFPLALVVMAVAFALHAPTAGSAANMFVYGHPNIKDLVVQASLLLPSGHLLVSVMWSLPYEVGMYILLPALFFLVQRNFSVWPIMMVWLVFVVNGHLVPSSGHNFIVAIPYFLPGIMAYVGFGRWQPRLSGGWLAPFLLALWTVILLKPNFHRMWFFCLLLGLALPFFRQMKSPLVLTPSRILARYSYGVYLTHPFALVILFYLLPHAPLAIRLAAALGALVTLPVLGYHLVEHPCIRLGSRLAARAEARYEQRELAQYRQTP